MKTLIAFLFTLFICLQANADAEPPELDRFNGCKEYSFCTAQTATGICTVLPASGDERTLKTMGKSLITFYSNRSVGAHVCDIISSDVEYDTSTTTGFQINAVSLTASTPILTLSGPLNRVWVTCPTIGTSVTVTAIVCAANN